MVTTLFILAYLITCCYSTMPMPLMSESGLTAGPNMLFAGGFYPAIHHHEQCEMNSVDETPIPIATSSVAQDCPETVDSHRAAEMGALIQEDIRLRKSEEELRLARAELEALKIELERANQSQTKAEQDLALTQGKLEASQQSIKDHGSMIKQLEKRAKEREEASVNDNRCIAEYSSECQSLKDQIQQKTVELDETKEKLRAHLEEKSIDKNLSQEIKNLENALADEKTKVGDMKASEKILEIVVEELKTKHGVFTSNGNVRVVFAEWIGLILIGCTGILIAIIALMLAPSLCRYRCKTSGTKQKFPVEIGSPAKTCDLDIEYNAADHRILDLFQDEFAQSQKSSIGSPESKQQNVLPPKEPMSFLRM